MAFIANTTVISNFSSVGHLDLLQARCKKLYITEQVFEEIQTGLLQEYVFYANIETQIFPFSEPGWIHLTTLNTPDELLTYHHFLTSLHNGEASCYDWFPQKETLLMLFIYPKSRQEDLSAEQLKTLRRLIERDYS